MDRPRFQSPRFLILYALAAAGGAIAYVPFLTILLPMQVTSIVGDADVEWLAYCAFAGAVAASIANIAFGWFSDATRNRKSWMLAGLGLSSAVLVSMSHARDMETLIGLIVLWQVFLNMMLAPLAAWAGDCVPDGQKGILGGLLAFSPAAGALAAAIVTYPGLAGPDARLVIVAVIVAACVLPAILFGAPTEFPELNRPTASDEKLIQTTETARSVVVRMWLARLLIQISEAALFAYLYFWFRSVDGSMTDSSVARIFSVILIASIPVALWTGRWADRSGRPILPLPVTAALGSAGLIAMALSFSLETAIAGYVLFGIATSVFLSLHTGQTLRVLPKPQTRGRDLGIFNLTNTGPSLVVPWMAIALVPVFGFSGLFYLLAGLALLAAILLASLPRPR